VAKLITSETYISHPCGFFSFSANVALSEEEKKLNADDHHFKKRDRAADKHPSQRFIPAGERNIGTFRKNDFFVRTSYGGGDFITVAHHDAFNDRLASGDVFGVRFAAHSPCVVLPFHIMALCL